ncbi:MAG: c-type cytochrome domain-containing protein [Myxococcota bacterium]
MRLLIGFAVGWLAGCDDYIFGEQVVLEDEVPAVTGIDGVLEVVDRECLGCHSEAQQLGDLDLETDFQGATVSVIGRYALPIIIPGDPENSVLYQKITATQGDLGGGMPTPEGLPQPVTDIFFDWIVSLEAPAE